MLSTQGKIGGESTWKMSGTSCRIKTNRRENKKKLEGMKTKWDANDVVYRTKYFMNFHFDLTVCVCVCIFYIERVLNAWEKGGKKVPSSQLTLSLLVTCTIQTIIFACTPSSTVMNFLEAKKRSSYTIMSSLQIIMNILHSFT